MQTHLSGEITEPLQPQVLGPYQLLQLLGRGGMGAVYKALHVNLQRHVALKLLPREGEVSAAAVARFYREMALIGQLDHPNVIRAHDAGEASGEHFLVMEYAPGMNLAEVLAVVGPLSVADASMVVCQVCTGLQYIGDNQLVHRDIKPSNLQLTEQGYVKILDLGLACWSANEAEESDDPHTELTGDCVLGTPDYIAPEQTQNASDVDIRADLYSLGCTLYKLLSGRVPFGKPKYASAASKLLAHCRDALPALPCNGVDVPEKLWQIIQRSTAKSPDERFESPEKFSEALKPLCHGADLAALIQRAQAANEASRIADKSSRPIVVGSAVTRRQKRPVQQPLSRSRRWLIGVAAIILTLGASTATVVWNGWLSSTSPADPRGTQPLATIPSKDDGASPPEIFGSEAAKLDAPPPAPLDELPPLQWHSLLDRPPTELYWPHGEGLSTWSYNDGLEQISAHCQRDGLLQLGKTEASDYRIQIGVHQTRWEGGVGLFLGVHQGKYRDQPCQVHQTIELRRYPIEDGKPPVALWRTLVFTYQNKHGRRETPSKSIASARVEMPHGEQTLELTVRDGDLIEVRWGGLPVEGLASASPQVEPLLQDAQSGPFGILVTGNSGIFRNARFMRLAPRE